MSTPYTAAASVVQQGPTVGFLPQNATYERSPDFRMRALLCDSRYRMSKHAVTATTSGKNGTLLNTSAHAKPAYQEVPNSVLDVSRFQMSSTQNNWGSYFDYNSMRAEANRAAGSSAEVLPGYSGMAPLLAAISRFNLTSMLENPQIPQQAAALKGRFFAETLRDVFTRSELVENEIVTGQGTVLQGRIVVLAEIGFALAALFFASSILIAVVFWTSRESHRPLNLRSDPASTVGLSLLFSQRLAQSSIIRSMHDRTRVDFYTAFQGEKFLTLDNELLKGDDNTGNSIFPLSCSTMLIAVPQNLL
jgi:hypothetical protein